MFEQEAEKRVFQHNHVHATILPVNAYSLGRKHAIRITSCLPNDIICSTSAVESLDS